MDANWSRRGDSGRCQDPRRIFRLFRSPGGGDERKGLHTGAALSVWPEGVAIFRKGGKQNKEEKDQSKRLLFNVQIISDCINSRGARNGKI